MIAGYVPRRSAVVGLAMVIVVGAALVGCGDDKPVAKLGAPVATTSTTAAVSPSISTTDPPAAGAPTTLKRPTGPVATTAAPATKAGPTASPATPPPAGRYQYATTGSSALGTTMTPFPAVTSLVIDTPTGGRQHSLRSLKDPAGQGLSTDFVLDYRPDGVYLVSAKVNVTTGAFVTNASLLPPVPVLFVPTGAAPGAHQESDVPTDTGANVKFVVDVVRTEAVTVGGTSVNALVVRTVATSAPGAPTTTRQELTVWFDPTSRLVVKETALITASALGGVIQFNANSDSTLQSLRPS